MNIYVLVDYSNCKMKCMNLCTLIKRTIIPLQCFDWSTLTDCTFKKLQSCIMQWRLMSMEEWKFCVFPRGGIISLQSQLKLYDHHIEHEFVIWHTLGRKDMHCQLQTLEVRERKLSFCRALHRCPGLWDSLFQLHIWRAFC